MLQPAGAGPADHVELALRTVGHEELEHQDRAPDLLGGEPDAVGEDRYLRALAMDGNGLDCPRRRCPQLPACGVEALDPIRERDVGRVDLHGSGEVNVGRSVRDDVQGWETIGRCAADALDERRCRRADGCGIEIVGRRLLELVAGRGGEDDPALRVEPVRLLLPVTKDDAAPRAESHQRRGVRNAALHLGDHIAEEAKPLAQVRRYPGSLRRERRTFGQRMRIHCAQATRSRPTSSAAAALSIDDPGTVELQLHFRHE